MCSESERNDVHSLSFLAAGKWVPVRTGEYDADCKHGRECADEMLGLIDRTGNPAIFGGIVRSIVEAGQFDGVEAGFCSRIGIIIVVNVSPGS